MTFRVSSAARWAAAAGLAAAAVAATGDLVADHVVEALQSDRKAAGLEPFERRPAIDAVALERARKIAALSHEQRLTYEEPIGDALRAAGEVRFDAASAHVDMVRGYKEPEKGFLKSWREYRSGWGRVLDPEYTALGAASQRAEDGWTIFVAVLVADTRIPDDPRPIETAIVGAVNRARAEQGLPALVETPELSALARSHSEDMLRRNFVAHVNPDGDDVRERVTKAEIRFVKVGENVHMNRGAKDPVAYAVEQWMASEGHRQTILDLSYSHTGAGVAIGEDGSLYFTQLFLDPLDR